MSTKRWFSSLLWLIIFSWPFPGLAAAESREVRAARKPVSPGTDATDLAVYFFSGDQRADPGGKVSYQFNLVNYSFFEARGVRFRFQLPSGFTFLGAEFPTAVSCMEANGLVACETNQLSPAQPDMASVVRLIINTRVASSSRGGRFELQASVTSETPESDPSNNAAHSVTQVYRHYVVTNVLDSGPGSLRKAIADANRECDRDGVPCRIDFAIAESVPETGWFTIRPVTALPPILANDLTIDGGTQTSSIGDTNPLGPEIELSGELCESGNGLEIHSSGESLVAGLAINGFPENGVLVTGPFSTLHSIRDNYIGTDPTGTFAAPNGLRGIACLNEGFFGQLDILRNVVSGNGKSGLFLAVGGFFHVEGNRIGTQAAADVPLPNGASGIYFGNQYFGNQSPCAVVTGNVIAYNHDFGVASEYYRNVAIQRNSIKANALSGIDFGLDGETTGLSFDELGRLRAEPHPVLDSARYDEASATTVIQGRFQDSYLYVYGAVADLYASPGSAGQGEKWLGQATSGGAAFVLVYPGNLLGQFITATATLNFYEGLAIEGETLVPCGDGLVHTTSEFSRPIPVTQ
jgi:hypothetical protein